MSNAGYGDRGRTIVSAKNSTQDNANVKETEITMEMSALSDRVSHVLELIKSLEERVGAILSPASPETDCCEKEAPSRTLLGENLRVISTRLDNAIESLKDVRSRVQL